ncbi:MAG: 4Fe-4S dicluster domain-containing protein [Armatimonadetes bacterium]|nr:4Fe-4S dicluster domain-containing protein [Armatimonadota bacterium]
MKLSVDADRCTLCGACVLTCPSDMVRRREDRIRIGRVACIECGHCVVVCPTGAIVDEEGTGTQGDEGALPSPESLKALMRRRRTVRRYRPDPVPPEIIEDCLDAARWAPTAANCQAQEYVVIANPATKDELRRRVEDYYRAFAEALADRENRAARLAALGIDPEAAGHPHVLAAVPAFVKSVEAGRDRLFFEAPVVIVIHAARDAVMPESACAFATLATVLMAEAHGLGTCLTGFASDALRTRADIREWLGIPPGNQVHYVVVMGWPDEPFGSVPERRPARSEWR